MGLPRAADSQTVPAPALPATTDAAARDVADLRADVGEGLVHAGDGCVRRSVEEPGSRLVDDEGLAGEGWPDRGHQIVDLARALAAAHEKDYGQTLGRSDEGAAFRRVAREEAGPHGIADDGGLAPQGFGQHRRGFRPAHQDLGGRARR